jgi:hypothetical protein
LLKVGRIKALSIIIWRNSQHQCIHCQTFFIFLLLLCDVFLPSHHLCLHLLRAASPSSRCLLTFPHLSSPLISCCFDFIALLLRIASPRCHLHLALALPFSEQTALLLRWRFSLGMKPHPLRDKTSSIYHCEWLVSCE